jgi:hypothetical protein
MIKIIKLITGYIKMRVIYMSLLSIKNTVSKYKTSRLNHLAAQETMKLMMIVILEKTLMFKIIIIQILQATIKILKNILKLLNQFQTKKEK